MIAPALLAGIVVLALCGLLGLTPDSRDYEYGLGPVIAQPEHRGYSSAANVATAADLAANGRLAADANIATVLCDTGLKYAPDVLPPERTATEPTSERGHARTVDKSGISEASTWSR